MKTWTEDDLERLIADGEAESNILEYKAADALSKQDAKKQEVGKDVSAMANGAGGVIIYGMAEGTAGRPTHIDGIVPASFSRDWLDQIIKSNIQPPVQDVLIAVVTLKDGKVAYVVTVPQAITLAPHMAPDHRYWWRSNGTTSRMVDFQVRDVMRRATTPELFADVTLSGPMPVGANRRVEIIVEIGNRSMVPALYTTITLAVPAEYSSQVVQDHWNWGQPFMTGGMNLNHYEVNLATPRDQPIYSGRTTRLKRLLLVMPSTTALAPFGLRLATPGFTSQRKGLLVWDAPSRITLDWSA
jgi:hypothetical protein